MQLKLYDDPFQNLAAAILRQAGHNALSPELDVEQEAKEFLRGEFAALLMRFINVHRQSVLEFLGIDCN